jgi:hypothetical protein
LSSGTGSFDDDDEDTLTVIYDGGHPILQLYLEANGQDTAIEAVVDIGAHKSLLPLRVAEELSIPKGHRRPTQGIGAGGHRVKTWSCESDVTAQLVVVRAGQIKTWSYQFSFAPTFAKTERALLGRSDFFHFFVVTFEERDRLLRLRRLPELPL